VTPPLWCETSWSSCRILISASPAFCPEHSDPAIPRFIFTYEITIRRAGTGPPCKLLWRRWTITDALGTLREVRGSGVVGEQPVLHEGDSFKYQSFCPLPTPSGTMDGVFTFQTTHNAHAVLFEAGVPRMEMLADPPCHSGIDA